MMTINDLHAQIHLPNAPSGDGVHRLPPCRPIEGLIVEEYPACPTNWMHGSAKVSSFFIPVTPGKHLWIDFNMNIGNPHDVAVVLSVQGVNPITGPIEGKKPTLRLEQYREKCPIHDEVFTQDLFCAKCDRKWPPQNYMTTASHQKGLFWIDGWRADGDTIRGFLITEETMRGVAAQTIGDERVWAVGIAFFLSKKAKPAPVVQPSPMRTAGFNYATAAIVYNLSGKVETMGQHGGQSRSMLRASKGGQHVNSVTCSAMTQPSATSQQDEGTTACSYDSPVAEIETKKLEVGAGAKIAQQLCWHDPNPLNYYKDEPDGVLYVNYCTEDDFKRIVEAGKKDRTKKGEGYLAELATGN